MLPHETTIHKLCQNPLARDKAKCLFFLASQRTGKSSGHDLGSGHGALAEICAFLASETTGVGEVTQEQARASACVDQKTFENALQAVRRVISLSKTLDPKRVTFNSLVRQHAVREDAGVAMMEVAQTLNQSGVLDETQLGLETAVMQCAIFHWVCTKVFELAVPDFPVYRQQYKFSRKAWSLACLLLDNHCTCMLKKLSAHAKTATTPSRAGCRQTRNRNDQPTLLSPAHTKHLSGNLTPGKSGLVGATKRKAPTNPGDDESPSKRRNCLYPRSSLKQDRTIPASKATSSDPGAAALTPSRKNTEETAICPNDEVEEHSTETIVVTPKKKPHISAWEAQRPKLAEMHSTPTKASSPTSPSDSQLMNGTPMTSTGMSDVFSGSPPNARSPHRQQRARFRLPSPGAEKSTSCVSDEEEKIHRRAGRNLRAPFLHSEAYSWNPSARTKERLERARRFEALMISKYGDPMG